MLQQRVAARYRPEENAKKVKDKNFRVLTNTFIYCFNITSNGACLRLHRVFHQGAHFDHTLSKIREFFALMFANFSVFVFP